MTIAVVTGAAHGLGQTFAAALARVGYEVAGLDVADMSETRSRAEGFLPVRCDVTSEEDVDRAIAHVAEELGDPQVLVNNAGVYPPIPFEETTLADWHRVMRVNLDGPFLVTRAAVPHMKAAGWGRVVNIVSSVVFLGPPELVAYTTSKAGLVGFTRALAGELGSANITVNAIAPGLTRTATAARTTGADGGFERVRDLQCVPRTGEPEDLVSTLLYVCARETGFLTGQTINVDGGSAKH